MLLDTERLCLEVETRLCAMHGLEYTTQDRAHVLGLDVRHACAWLARRFGLPRTAIASLERLYEDLLCAAIEREAAPLPGAMELVAALRAAGLPLGVASNSRRRVVELALRVAGMHESFGAIVAADDVESPKPAPDAYLLACHLLDIPPTSALALEDSKVGMRAALTAGLDCWLVIGHSSATAYQGEPAEIEVRLLGDLLAA